jgi:4-amino-4-deoxychorismate lyase
VNLLVNGEVSASIAALDRGLQYGDGLFETIAIRRGRPRLLSLHLDRLASGCRRLGIQPPDAASLTAEIAAVSPAPEAVVKVIVTRGGGGRGYRPPRDASPTRIVAGFDDPGFPPEHRVQGVRVRSCETRVAQSPALAGLKHLGRLEQVLARAEWCDESIAEGLMRDEEDRFACGTQSNLFAVLGGELLTPRVDRCGVAGVMRRVVLQWAAGRAIVTREVGLSDGDLHAAEEVFLTSALIGAWPVAELDGRGLRRGRLSTEFMQWLDRD